MSNVSFAQSKVLSLAGAGKVVYSSNDPAARRAAYGIGWAWVKKQPLEALVAQGLMAETPYQLDYLVGSGDAARGRSVKGYVITGRGAELVAERFGAMAAASGRTQE